MVELTDLLATWEESANLSNETDLTLSTSEAEALAWGGNG